MLDIVPIEAHLLRLRLIKLNQIHLLVELLHFGGIIDPIRRFSFRGQCKIG